MTSTLLVPDSFGQWLWQRKRRLALPGLGVVITVASGSLPWIERAANWPWLTTVLLGLQFVIILFLQFIIPKPLRDARESPRASEAVDQFHRAWRYLWLFWMIEYLGLTAREFALQTAQGNSIITVGAGAATTAIVLNLLNNLPTAALVMCYIVASERTVTMEAGIARPLQLPWDRVLAVLFIFTALDIGVRVNAHIGMVALPWNLGKALNWVSGLAAGLATALVVGRLDSKFIGLPTWALAPLYGYAVIQTGWPTLSEDVAVRTVLLNMALALKCLLFVVMAWLFKSGVFLYYVERLGAIFDEVRPAREFFLARVQRQMDLTPPAMPGRGGVAGVP